MTLPGRMLLVTSLLLAGDGDVDALDWAPIVENGDPATGLPGDPAIVTVGPTGRLGDNGEVFYTAHTGSLVSVQLEPAGLYRWMPEAAATLIVGYGEVPELPIQHPIRVDVNRNGAWAIADAPDEVAPGCDPESDAQAERLLRSDGSGGSETLLEMGTPIADAPDGLRFAGIARWGTAGVFSLWPPLLLADSGALAFGAELASDPCLDDGREALFAVAPGDGVSLVALSGEPSPILDMDFDALALSSAGLDDAGQLAFAATLRSDTEVASAVFRWDPIDGLTLIDMLTPPTPSSPRTVLRVGPPAIAASGAVAYFLNGEVWGPDGAGGVARRFALGDPVPGGPEGAVFAWTTTFPWTPRNAWINAADQVAFVNPIERPQPGEPWPEFLGDGLFRADAGGPVELLVKAGDAAPHSTGATFGTRIHIIAFGDAGEIAFSADLDRPGDDGPDGPETAIYLIDASERLRPILFEQELAGLLPLDAIEDDPNRASLAFDADFSHVAMSPYVFAGPTAVFVATVPEPAAVQGAIAALLALAAVRVHFARSSHAR